MDIDETHIAAIERLDLRPGDTIVVRCKAHCLSAETAARIEAYIGERLPGHKILVLDKTLYLSVVSAPAGSA